MKVEKIEAELIEWLPTCQGAVVGITRQYRIRAGESPTCSLPAHYRVDGIAMCERHAGKAVLAFAVDKGDI